MKKKACKVCKIFFEDECPNGHGDQAVTNWKGRIYIINKDKSEIGKKMGIERAAEYAIKVT